VALLRADGTDVELHVLAGVPPDAVATWLNAADTVLLTSAHEGSPNVVKEALACNVPVVSVDVGDVRERIHEIAGCYIADPTPEDLAAKVERAVRREGAITARERVADISLERVAARLWDIYATVAGAAARSNGGA
jgi:teichuronic acid biosynthesis glycosyltransferase TuaC